VIPCSCARTAATPIVFEEYDTSFSTDALFIIYTCKALPFRVFSKWSLLEIVGKLLRSSCVNSAALFVWCRTTLAFVAGKRPQENTATHQTIADVNGAMVIEDVRSCSWV